MEKKKVYIRNKFIFFVLIVYLIWVIIAVKASVNYLYWEYAADYTFKLNYFVKLLIPFLILITFSLLPLNKYIRIILNCIFFLFLLIAPFYTFLSSTLHLLTLYPKEKQYAVVLKKYAEKELENPIYIKHFPVELPDFYTKYESMIDDREPLIYLKFCSTDEYIDEILKKYKDEILLKTSVEKIHHIPKLFTSYSHIWSENSDVFILKTSDVKSNIFSGFAIDKAKKEILFFYSKSEFTLKIEKM